MGNWNMSRAIELEAGEHPKRWRPLRRTPTPSQNRHLQAVMTVLLDLPNECLGAVAGHLPFVALKAFSSVQKRLRQISVS